MLLSTLVTLIIMSGVVYFGYKILKKVWHRADMLDAVDEINMISEEAKASQIVDLDAHKQEKERVEQLLNMKGKK